MGKGSSFYIVTLRYSESQRASSRTQNLPICGLPGKGDHTDSFFPVREPQQTQPRLQNEAGSLGHSMSSFMCLFLCSWLSSRKCVPRSLFCTTTVNCRILAHVSVPLAEAAVPCQHQQKVRRSQRRDPTHQWESTLELRHLVFENGSGYQLIYPHMMSGDKKLTQQG